MKLLGSHRLQIATTAETVQVCLLSCTRSRPVLFLSIAVSEVVEDTVSSTSLVQASLAQLIATRLVLAAARPSTLVQYVYPADTSTQSGLTLTTDPVFTGSLTGLHIIDGLKSERVVAVDVRRLWHCRDPRFGAPLIALIAIYCSRLGLDRLSDTTVHMGFVFRTCLPTTLRH